MHSKSEVLEGAAGLFLRYGIKSVTMDDVSRELGMSKKTLYQFINNKADLIQQMMELHIKEEKKMIARIQETADDAIHEIVILAKHISQMLREMPPGFTYDLQKYYRKCWDIMESYKNNHIYGSIKGNIERGIQQGVYREEVDSDIIAKLYVGKMSILTDEGIFPLRNYKKDILLKQYISYHLRGIASAKGLKLLAKHTKNLL